MSHQPCSPMEHSRKVVVAVTGLVGPQRRELLVEKPDLNDGRSCFTSLSLFLCLVLGRQIADHHVLRRARPVLAHLVAESLLGY